MSKRNGSNARARIATTALPPIDTGAEAAEEWRTIPETSGNYDVSSLGRVRSHTRKVRSVTLKAGVPKDVLRTAYGRVLSPVADRQGYLRVKLGTEQYRRVQQLVLLAFVGPPPPGMVIRHLNDVPGDNRLVNLAYGTKSSNARDRKFNRPGVGRLHALQVAEIKAHLAAGVRRSVLARQFGVSWSTITDIYSERSHSEIAPAVLEAANGASQA